MRQSKKEKVTDGDTARKEVRENTEYTHEFFGIAEMQIVGF